MTANNEELLLPASDQTGDVGPTFEEALEILTGIEDEFASMIMKPRFGLVPAGNENYVVTRNLNPVGDYDREEINAMSAAATEKLRDSSYEYSIDTLLWLAIDTKKLQQYRYHPIPAEKILELTSGWFKILKKVNQERGISLTESQKNAFAKLVKAVQETRRYWTSPPPNPSRRVNIGGPLNPSIMSDSTTNSRTRNVPFQGAPNAHGTFLRYQTVQEGEGMESEQSDLENHFERYMASNPNTTRSSGAIFKDVIATSTIRARVRDVGFPHPHLRLFLQHSRCFWKEDCLFGLVVDPRPSDHHCPHLLCDFGSWTMDTNLRNGPKFF